MGGLIRLKSIERIKSQMEGPSTRPAVCLRFRRHPQRISIVFFLFFWIELFGGEIVVLFSFFFFNPPVTSIGPLICYAQLQLVETSSEWPLLLFLFLF